MSLTNILWLDVRVHEVTFLVKILQAEKNLPGDTLDDAGRNAFPAVLLDEGEEVCAKGLKSDAYMGPGGDCVGERIEKGDNMSPSGVRGGGIGYLA
jgi:hypothetical protein